MQIEESPARHVRGPGDTHTPAEIEAVIASLRQGEAAGKEYADAWHAAKALHASDAPDAEKRRATARLATAGCEMQQTMAASKACTLKMRALAAKRFARDARKVRVRQAVRRVPHVRASHRRRVVHSAGSTTSGAGDGDGSSDDPDPERAAVETPQSAPSAIPDNLNDLTAGQLAGLDMFASALADLWARELVAGGVR